MWPGLACEWAPPQLHPPSELLPQQLCQTMPFHQADSPCVIYPHWCIFCTAGRCQPTATMSASGQCI